MKKRDLYYERIPTKFFRENVKYLGFILGKVIKEQEGQKFFEIVEKVRKLSKANKINSNSLQTNQKVINAVKNLSPKNSFKLTRAFTHFMNFINLAELIDASRGLNEYENNKKRIDSVNTQLNNLITRKYLYSLNFATNNSEYEISPYIAVSQIADTNVDLLIQLYDTLPENIKNSKYGKILGEFTKN